MKSYLLPLLAFCLSPLVLDAGEYPTVGQVTRLDPALDQLIAPDAKIEKLCEGFNWAEGPVWKDGAILFSDVPENVIYRWAPGMHKAEVFLKPSGLLRPKPGFDSGGSNGLTLDGQGRLIICQQGEQRIARLEADRTFTAIVGAYEGQHFSSPNDVAIRRNGDIYFTDPPYGLEGLNDSRIKEIKFNGVYRYSADGKVSAVIKDLKFPNGIAFSPDERILYVGSTDIPDPFVEAYDVQPDGSLANPRRFFDARPLSKPDGADGLCDGMKVDAQGNLFATGPKGVLVISPQGKHLGTISTGTLIANCAWGDDGATLYLTAEHTLCRIHTLTKGDRFPLGR